MTPETQLKVFIFLERLWMVAAALGVICVVYFILQKDNDSAVFFLGFFILSGLLFLMRKRQRVKFQGEIKRRSEGRVQNSSKVQKSGQS